MTPPHKYMKEVVKEGKRVRWPTVRHFGPRSPCRDRHFRLRRHLLGLEDLTAYNLIQQLEKAFGGK
jgi:hypothetical protein